MKAERSYSATMYICQSEIT